MKTNALIKRHRVAIRLVPLLLLTVLKGCGSSSNNGAAPPPPPPPPPPVTASFNVTVSNLTNAQPLSPVAVIAHGAPFALFSVGEPATAGLEVLAEGGDNTALLDEADASGSVIATVSGAAPIGPAGSETVSVEITESNVATVRLSVGTMLVNTNDAFSGVNGMDIGGMAVGEVRMARAIAYDAGTEANTESAADIPGPVAGGEGFNAARSDRSDQVAMHAGVVSRDDGFATSDLTNQHRFDNPVVMVRIERIN